MLLTVRVVSYVGSVHCLQISTSSSSQVVANILGYKHAKGLKLTGIFCSITKHELHNWL